jgi:hypothetical protein
MTANGRQVAEGNLARTIPIKLSMCEGLDVGTDTGSPVDFTYEMPFAFEGKIEKVTIQLKPQAKDAQPRKSRQRKRAVEARPTLHA